MIRFKPFHISFVFLALALLCFCSGCSSGSTKVTTSTLHGLVDQGTSPVIVDVRSDDEYAAGHIPGAIHIPFYSVGKRHEEISSDKDTPVVIYCAHGPRAWWAAFALRRKGFSQVTTLEGHFKQWRKSGFGYDKKNP